MEMVRGLEVKQGNKEGKTGEEQGFFRQGIIGHLGVHTVQCA